MVRTSMPGARVATAIRLARTAPVILGSVLLHAGIAVALVATAGGHARASRALPVATLDVDVAQIESPTLEPVWETALPKVEHDQTMAEPTHSHPYPVAPSHDAHPHDPSLHHVEASSGPAVAEPAHDAEPAQAAQVQIAQASSASALPRFVLSSGAGLAIGATRPMDGSAAGVGAATAASGGDDVIVAASAVQVAAKLVHSAVAAYPAGARADDVEGDVGVEIVVDREGRVVEARIARPAGQGFDEAALVAIRTYRFTPAQREGRAVRVRMSWSVQFRLR